MKLEYTIAIQNVLRPDKEVARFREIIDKYPGTEMAITVEKGIIFSTVTLEIKADIESYRQNVRLFNELMELLNKDIRIPEEDDLE